jgi:cell division protein FtsL
MTKPDPSDNLADWSDWSPFADAVKAAPKEPGVYMAKDTSQVVYVGMAGERRGKGIKGRLTVYRRGRGAVSGLGEAAMDRALRDTDWLRQRLEQVEQGADWRIRDWATAALERAELQIRWATKPTGEAARELEHDVLVALADVDLWNRALPAIEQPDDGEALA